MNKPLISVIITCHGEAPELPAMVNCLKTQRQNLIGKHSRTGAPVQYTMGEYLESPEIVVVCDGPYNGVWDLGWDSMLAVEKAGGVGHHTREPGIHKANGEWIVLTNCDNYFMAGWLDRVSRAARDHSGLIYWNCVNNLWTWGARESQLRRGCIDLSCVAVRAEVAKSVGFPFREYDGDFDYIRACGLECLTRGLGSIHINEFLCVHN